MPSFYIELKALNNSGSFGGDLCVESSRFETIDQAQNWATSYLMLQKVLPKSFQVKCLVSDKHPSIFRHCLVSNASFVTVGERCPHCQKIVTKRDAITAGKR